MQYSAIDYKIIGNRIQERRNELDITQENFSNELGISSTYLSRIENGKAHPTLDMYSLIAYQLNTDLSFLITGTSTLEKTCYVSQLNEICSKASKSQLRLIIKLAEAVLDE